MQIITNNCCHLYLWNKISLHKLSKISFPVQADLENGKIKLQWDILIQEFWIFFLLKSCTVAGQFIIHDGSSVSHFHEMYAFSYSPPVVHVCSLRPVPGVSHEFGLQISETPYWWNYKLKTFREYKWLSNYVWIIQVHMVYICTSSSCNCVVVCYNCYYGIDLCPNPPCSWSNTNVIRPLHSRRQLLLIESAPDT